MTVDVGNTLHADVSGISDLDNLMDAQGNVIAGATDVLALPSVHFQWQYVDAVSGNFVDYAGATSADFVVPEFLLTAGLGVRVKISYVDGKGYTEQLTSAPTVAAITLPGGHANTAPTITVGTQFNGIGNTTALAGQAFDYFSPFAALVAGGAGIFNDQQQAPNTLTYSAVLTNGSPLSSANLAFNFDPTTGAGEFKSISVGPDGLFGTADDVPLTLDTPGQIGVRVTATDNGGLSVTNTFVIDVVPPNSPPLAVDDNYTTFENVGLTTLSTTGVLHNDSDPNADPFTAAVVTGKGPTNGKLTFHADGTFVYVPNKNFVGTDTFTYQDKDSAGALSNEANVTINVVNTGKITVVPTPPAGSVASVTESFAGSALPPDPGTLALSWDTSSDGGTTWTPTGVASSTFAPALTGPAGIFLRGTANFQNSGSTVSVASDPVYFISDNDLGNNLTGDFATSIIFANGGDDVIAAGIGSMFAYGGDGNDTFVASIGDGNAVYDGQAGTNTYDLSQTGANATVDLVAGKASSVQTGSDTLVSIQNVVGSRGDDTITGDANNNVFFAVVDDGNDTYTGGGGIDTYDLSKTAGGTTVNLALGTAAGADTGTDTLVGFTNVVGSSGNDRFVAATGDGNNSYAGGLGTDTYDLSATTAAAVVNLVTGKATSGAGTDTLSGIENVLGGSGNDTITGDANDNVITGSGGADTATGGLGNDTFVATVGDGNDRYDGGGGTDTYDASAITTAVTINLNQSKATGVDIGTDVVLNAENAIGGAGNDLVVGNALGNVLIGGAGNDQLQGNGGADTMSGGAGNDTYNVDNAGDVVNEARARATTRSWPPSATL